MSLFWCLYGWPWACFTSSEAAAQRCSVKKVFLEISQNSQENTCARISFFNKVAGLSSATLLKKRLWHSCFPVNFLKFLRIPFLQITSRRLLLLCQYYIYNLFYTLSSMPSPPPLKALDIASKWITPFLHKHQVNSAQPSLFLAFQNFQH